MEMVSPFLLLLLLLPDLVSKEGKHHHTQKAKCQTIYHRSSMQQQRYNTSQLLLSFSDEYENVLNQFTSAKRNVIFQL